MYLSNDKGTSNLHFCRENVALIHRAAAKPGNIFRLMAVGISLRISSAMVAKGFFMPEKQCRSASCCPVYLPNLQTTAIAHALNAKFIIVFQYLIY
jgi:hypothetical protein